MVRWDLEDCFFFAVGGSDGESEDVLEARGLLEVSRKKRDWVPDETCQARLRDAWPESANAMRPAGGNFSESDPQQDSWARLRIPVALAGGTPGGCDKHNRMR